MAMESGAEMDMGSGHAAHAMHAGETAGTDADCGHCPPAACQDVESCIVEMSSGCQPDEPRIQDSRRAKLTLKDAPPDLPGSIAPAVIAVPFTDHRTVPSVIAYVAYEPGYQPPLNLLNCIFLI